MFLKVSRSQQRIVHKLGVRVAFVTVSKISTWEVQVLEIKYFDVIVFIIDLKSILSSVHYFYRDFIGKNMTVVDKYRNKFLFFFQIVMSGCEHLFTSFRLDMIFVGCNEVAN